MPQLSPADGEDLGANDELLRFKDEGEHEDKTSVAADRDLDDVKSSLVNESETNSGSDSEADRRARTDPGVASRARQNQLFGEVLRRHQAAGLFQPPPYMGYPFFMIPDLCGPYLAGGGLAAGTRAYLPFQWPLLDVPGRAAMRDSATPTHLSSGAPPHMGHLHPLLSYCPEAFSPQRASPSFSPETGVSRPPHAACYAVSPGSVAQMPHTFDWLQGQPVYPMAGGFSPAALNMNTSMSSLASSSFSPRVVASSPPSVSHAAVTVKQEARDDSPLRKSVADVARESSGENKAHIKKPLNAFMLFMREERPNVVAQCQVKESATINQILGQRWHSLTKDEQSKYYELARKERLVHSQLYPGWSARDNYGKKKKRKKTKSETQQGAAADDSSPPPKRGHMSPDEAPHVHALLTHPRSLTTAAASAHARSHLSRPHTVSHLTHTHLSQASPASSVDSPATPTAALASPAAPAPTHTEHTHSPYGHTSPQADQPLALTTKPLRSTHPLGPSTSPPHTPPPLPFLVPPPSSSHHNRRANQVCFKKVTKLCQDVLHRKMQEAAKRAVVVSVSSFEPGAPFAARRGALRDAKRIHRILSQLDFKVDLHQDLDSRQIYSLFQKESRRPVAECFLAVLSSHGEDGYVFGADGRPVSLSRLFAFFDTADMEQKVKVFLVQACRGGAMDDGVETDSGGVEETDLGGAYSQLSVPVNTLVMYATTPGYVAFMNPMGSVFLQTFCSLLEEEDHRRLELTRLMTRLSHRVAYTFQAKSHKFGPKKEMPCFLTRMTRDVFPFASW